MVNAPLSCLWDKERMYFLIEATGPPAAMMKLE